MHRFQPMSALEHYWNFSDVLKATGIHKFEDEDRIKWVILLD